MQLKTNKHLTEQMTQLPMVSFDTALKCFDFYAYRHSGKKQDFQNVMLALF